MTATITTRHEIQRALNAAPSRRIELPEVPVPVSSLATVMGGLAVIDQGNVPTCAAAVTTQIASIHAAQQGHGLKRYSIDSLYRDARNVPQVAPEWGTTFMACVAAWYRFGLKCGDTRDHLAPHVKVVDLSPQDWETAKELLQHQVPLAVVIPLDTSLLRIHGSPAELTGPSAGDSRIASHVLLAVAATRQGDILTKNSWGTTWGDQGFAWIPRRLIEDGYIESLHFVDTDGITTPRGHV